jgi:hypothetical protein
MSESIKFIKRYALNNWSDRQIREYLSRSASVNATELIRMIRSDQRKRDMLAVPKMKQLVFMLYGFDFSKYKKDTRTLVNEAFHRDCWVLLERENQFKSLESLAVLLNQPTCNTRTARREFILNAYFDGEATGKQLRLRLLCDAEIEPDKVYTSEARKKALLKIDQFITIV